eukprot:TRINITY_DN3526_c0_g1_i1.p2 TRINITY_DN3526_c0_g1~~TRINITY_DN3526_c0_g1_i1.p2  ORF type:complete len:123 (-),score=9.54 TRINITY_DN3526_c0_g1_i1:37-405(-)
MSFLKPQISLDQLVMAGTHNSGTSSMTKTLGIGLHPEKFAKCQNFNILAQLISGVRYFDLRVGLNKKNELVIVHGIVLGQSIEEILRDQIALFIRNFPSEFLFLHFERLKLSQVVLYSLYCF